MVRKVKSRSDFGTAFPFYQREINRFDTDIFVIGATSDLVNTDPETVSIEEAPRSETSDYFQVIVPDSEVPLASVLPPLLKSPQVVRSFMPAFGLMTASALLCTGYLFSPSNVPNPPTVETISISHDIPEILLPPTKEVGIFEYTNGELLIHTQPNFGISSYAAAISSTDITELLEMSPEEQLSLVNRFDADLKTYTKSDLRPVLDLTIEIIGDNSNVRNPDTSYAGLRNRRKNVIHPDITLSVPVTFGPESPRLEEIVDSQSNSKIPGLGKVIQDYFELKQIERDIPAVSDEKVMNEVARNIAFQYNTSKVNGTQSMYDLSLYSKQDRIDLANRLYRETSDRKSQNYMTTDEILELVNFGSKERIQYNQMQGNFSRNDFNKNKLNKRRQDLLQETLEMGYANLARKDILRLANDNGVSERTIRRDLQQISFEAPYNKYKNA